MGNHITQSENGGIYLTYIQKKLKGQFSGKEIGRGIQHVFKGTLVKSVRNKEHWKTLTKLYYGLTWKVHEETASEPRQVHRADVLGNANIHSPLSKDDGQHDKLTSQNGDSPNVYSPDSHTITLTKNDHKDMSTILKTILPDLPDKTSLLFQSQIKSMNSSPFSRRWSTEIIKLCLTIYCRSPRSYQDLSKSGFLTLPSARQI